MVGLGLPIVVPGMAGMPSLHHMMEIPGTRWDTTGGMFDQERPYTQPGHPFGMPTTSAPDMEGHVSIDRLVSIMPNELDGPPSKEAMRTAGSHGPSSYFTAVGMPHSWDLGSGHGYHSRYWGGRMATPMEHMSEGVGMQGMPGLSHVPAMVDTSGIANVIPPRFFDARRPGPMRPGNAAWVPSSSPYPSIGDPMWAES